MPRGSWGWTWACSIFVVKRALRWSLLQELSCTESFWIWQLHFLLCAAMQREFVLPSDVYLNFTCVHNSQEKVTNWENICFHKSQETVAADSQTVKVPKSELFYTVCHYMISFTCLKGNRKFILYAAIITAMSLHKEYLLHPTAGFWNTTQKGGWNHQPHSIWLCQLNLNKLKNDLPVTLSGIQQKITLK